MRVILIISVFILLNTSCNNYRYNESDKSNKTIVVNNKSQTEIKFVGTWYKQGEREKLITNFVRKYNFLNQDINVVITFPEEIPGYLENIAKTLQTQIQLPQSDWDILLLNNNYTIEIEGEPNWPKKYLVDFSAFDEFKNNTIPNLVSDSVKNLWSGIIPGPFVEGFNYAMWCNTNVAKKMGIEIKQIGMTFDDFLMYIKAAYEYNSKNPNDYIIPIFEAGGDWKTLMKFFEQLYASELNDKVEYFKNNTSEKKITAWYNTLIALEKLAHYKPLSPEWTSMKWSENINLMLEDKFLFHANGSWMYNHWQNSDQNDKLKDVMPTEFPVFNTGGSYPAGYQIVWGIPKNAKNKEEAIKFLLALNSSEFAEQFVRYTKCPTGIKGSLSTVSLGLDQFEDFNYKISEKYGNNTFVSVGNQTIFGLSGKNNKNYAYEVMTGEISAEKAILAIRKDLKKSGINIIQN